MLRIAAALLIWVVLVGGTGLYLRQHSHRARSATPAVESAMVAGYRLELTPTFAAAPDPFALRLDVSGHPPALVARMNGAEVLRREGEIAAGETLVVDPLPPVLEGRNEVYIEAAPPGEEALQAHALRVRVLRGAQTIADETLWSEAGAALSGGVTFEARDSADPEDAHVH